MRATTTAAAPFTVGRMLASMLDRVRHRLDERRLRREAREAAARLRGFDDRMLRDIGVGRADIERATRYGLDRSGLRPAVLRPA
jgi:uncharacterized protein YjiS (DUF1127 family)